VSAGVGFEWWGCLLGWWYVVSLVCVGVFWGGVWLVWCGAVVG